MPTIRHLSPDFALFLQDFMVNPARTIPLKEAIFRGKINGITAILSCVAIFHTPVNLS